MKKNSSGVVKAVKSAMKLHPFVTTGTILCVAASVVASLVPPLILARAIDRLTVGTSLSVYLASLYFGSLLLEGLLSSAQESLLVIFGQKMTHALRTEMSQKLTNLSASTLVNRKPCEIAARFSNDVDTVESLFTSGIISMIADACRIISVLVVIAVKNTGLTLVLLIILPFFAFFTRRVQKKTLAPQIENRKAIVAESRQVLILIF